jgi:hypothetical protein
MAVKMTFHPHQPVEVRRLIWRRWARPRREWRPATIVHQLTRDRYGVTMLWTGRRSVFSAWNMRAADRAGLIIFVSSKNRTHA